MITLLDIAEMLAQLQAADRDHIFVGMMPRKKPHSIGVYHNKRSGGKKVIAVGGKKCSSYNIKKVSFLVHWDEREGDTEVAAARVYEVLEGLRNVTVNGKKILFAQLSDNEPIGVGTDDDGIYEMVIEADIYYEREE